MQPAIASIDPPRRFTATLTRKGQMTLPASVRSHLGASAGRKLEFVIDPDGAVRLASPRFAGLADVVGSVPALERRMSMSQMREAVADDRATRYKAQTAK
jgi:antitoxin PrlF